MVPMHAEKSRKWALHEPAVARELAEAKYRTATGPRSQRVARAGTQGKSPTPSSLRGRCGRGPPAVRICSVHGPNACAKRKEATHEPDPPGPSQEGSKRMSAPCQFPSGGVRGGFTVPMRGQVTFGVPHCMKSKPYNTFV